MKRTKAQLQADLETAQLANQRIQHDLELYYINYTDAVDELVAAQGELYGEKEWARALLVRVNDLEYKLATQEDKFNAMVSAGQDMAKTEGSD